MLVYLHQYREDDADETVATADDDAVTDAEGYFNTDDVGPDEEWERIEYGDRSILRKATTHENVAGVSLPDDVESPRETPGVTVQLRVGGGTEYVENAEVVEVVDEDP